MKVIPETCCVCKFDIYVFIKTVKLPIYQFKTYFTVKCELEENSYKNMKFPVFHAKTTDYYRKNLINNISSKNQFWSFTNSNNICFHFMLSNLVFTFYASVFFL